MFEQSRVCQGIGNREQGKEGGGEEWRGEIMGDRRAVGINHAELPLILQHHLGRDQEGGEGALSGEGK